MRKNGGTLLLVLLIVMCHGVTSSMGMGLCREGKEEEDWRKRKEGREEWEEEGEEETEREREMEGGEELFLLHDTKDVVKTDAGEMKIVRSYGGRIIDRPMHIGFITMEPKSLFIPQYLDSSLILFIHRGEAKVGLIYKDELAERRLKIGDIYRIPAGSAFYLVNTGEGQRLHVICSIDPSESLGCRSFQSFFVGGGIHPPSILSGFDLDTLATAFNVTRQEVREIMIRQKDGPIVFIGDSRAPGPSLWSRFLELKEQDRLEHVMRMVEFHQEPNQLEEEQSGWSWRKLLRSMFGQDNKKTGESVGKSPDSYNIYDRRPDFRNNYGWSSLLDGHDYGPLKQSGIGVYLVNLTAGSMMAPHVNPTAAEYGIVLRGSGTIQIVFPNGTQAMNAKVTEGDVFWVPRYFPFCQTASRTSPFEFFGFTTSARRNRPQFLVGSNSLLHTLGRPELAAALGVSEERFRRIIDTQREAVILPSASASPPDETEGGAEKAEKVIRSFGNEYGYGFLSGKIM